MALAAFQAVSGLQRAFLRSAGGPSRAGASGTACTGWVNANAPGTGNATMQGAGATIPISVDGPIGSNLGPVARHVDDYGFHTGLSTTGQANWAFLAALNASSLTSFRNIFSSHTGATVSLYGNAGALILEDGSSGSTGFTMSTSTVYRVICQRTATNYRLWINGSLVWTSSGMTPTGIVEFVTAAYGGGAAAWSGDWWAFAIYFSDVSGSITALDNALKEEVEGSSTVNAVMTAIGPSPAGTINATVNIAATSAGVGPSPAGLISAGYGIPATMAGVGPSPQGLINATDQNAIMMVAVGPSPAGTITATVNIAMASAGVGPSPAGTILCDGPAVPGFDDDFEGTDGALKSKWIAVNSADLPGVTQTSGRYRAELTDNASDKTTWFHDAIGRADVQALTWPFEAIAYNVGIGQTGNSQTPPAPNVNSYTFCGLHVNNTTSVAGTPPNVSKEYSHLVVGYRGPSGRTLEMKNNANSASNVIDAGTNILAGTRADLRVVGNASRQLFWYWREPGSTSWIPIVNTNNIPTFGPTVYVGLVTYAFGLPGIPFVGTADAIDSLDVNVPAVMAAVGPSPSGTINATVRISGTMAGVGPSPSGTINATVNVAAAMAGVGPSPAGIVNATVNVAAAMAGVGPSPAGLITMVDGGIIMIAVGPSPRGTILTATNIPGAMVAVGPSPQSVIQVAVVAPPATSGWAAAPWVEPVPRVNAVSPVPGALPSVFSPLTFRLLWCTDRPGTPLPSARVILSRAGHPDSVVVQGATIASPYRGTATRIVVMRRLSTYEGWEIIVRRRGGWPSGAWSIRVEALVPGDPVPEFGGPAISEVP